MIGNDEMWIMHLYDPDICEGHFCPKDCDNCQYVESNLYDEEEILPNCTVQILRNSVTGATSVGWWENKHEQ